jgi:hypothetical protein
MMVTESPIGDEMEFHAIDRICPFCALAKLSYKRPGQHGDVYECARESGGCGGDIVHRRQKGGAVCGIVPILKFGIFGRWEACSKAALPERTG